jgi:hypothetical protein
LRWSIGGTGEEIASIGFEARLGEKDGYIRLHWTSTNRWSGEKRQCENRIELTTHAQPLGGRRWWFVCPHTGQLAERLHLPSGAYTFACRKAYRLAYRSQRETPRDRALSGAFALRRKLGADGGIGDYVTKPKGMHWRTFERAMERIDRAEGIVDAHRSPARSPQPDHFPIANHKMAQSRRSCPEPRNRGGLVAMRQNSRRIPRLQRV